MNAAVSPLSTHDILRAAAIAQALLDGFNHHYALFREASCMAKFNFEAGDVIAQRNSVRNRITFYDARVLESVSRLKQEFAAETLSDLMWSAVKQQYIALLLNHQQIELAETFFNSVCCRILHRTYFHNDFIFYRPAVSTEYIEESEATYRSYYVNDLGLVATFKQILLDFSWNLSFVDLDRDIMRILSTLRHHLAKKLSPEFNSHIEVLASPFYRSKAAYIIGKATHGELEIPFAIPLYRNQNNQLYVDAALFEMVHIRQLFSLSRAYFLVDMEVPSAYVQFLHDLIPGKSRAELYTMLGLGKQGKTMFYRELIHHLRHSSDPFVSAPGTKGMVMIVFTLPSFPFVFKIIKDVFAPPKEVDRATVRMKYLLVKQHDRVGRMADSLEFSDVALPRSRFDPALLAEMQQLAPSIVEEDGDSVVFRHMYIECRMKPLNLYIEHRKDQEVEAVIRDYGNALRELAIANIFPGDMLFKNFGVTRAGRVVFYDYDEIEYMTDCDFRRIPPPPAPEFEMSAETWFSGNKNEVYPEEFGGFLLARSDVKQAFNKYHADLLTQKFWQDTKMRIKNGIVEDFFPYPQALRFSQNE
ncbi:bifunctional isocitrate dehydrogenase kinase/phosphatase [uncultured Deefgea sp.]|uniref:bifunctional isocitrate dehydrogenase kinase/phosphatase n=1 Tax=uncultured Deefgea sp. TaxID=1304914 RepID=UPI00260E3F62|nr:bifunctional isocitrate dehydrogenase kinase/phosphatase [uncultured Deefgea sp.]